MSEFFDDPFERACARFAQAQRDKIDEGVPPPNAPSTIARKGHGRTLIDTELMKNEIDYEISDENGTKRGLIGVFGERARIAEIHEYGSSDGRIPERSFQRSSFDEKKEEILSEMSEDAWNRITVEFRK
jgi:hypothetical protein